MVANREQAEFWNAQPGHNWVLHQVDLDAISEEAGAALLRAYAPRPGERVLDIGCGAGTSSFAFARLVGPTGHVVGADISAPLLARAEERRRDLGLGHVRFELADGQDHAFPAGAFDLAASRFGVMFFADPVAAFANIGNSLRRGGRIAFVVWAGVEGNPWFLVQQEAAVARLGPVEPMPPDAPGPMAFRDIDRVLGILAAAGFAECEGEKLDVDFHHTGGLDAVLRIAAHIGPAVGVVREKNGTPEDMAAILEAVAAGFRRYESADGIRIPTAINLVTARRP